MPADAKPKIKLSPSALSLYLDCPRCFWLEKIKKVKRPRGIFPSLPGGMDRVIKSYFDGFRNLDKNPPELAGQDFAGIRLYSDQKQLDLWRSWRTGLEFTDADGSVLSGALDDLLTRGEFFIPFDYKTKGSPTTEADATKYYQKQLDCYALMLEANSFKPAGFGYLLYYSPGEVQENGRVLFQLQPIKLETNTGRAREIFRNAVRLLSRPMPESSPACEYCAWLSLRKNS